MSQFNLNLQREAALDEIVQFVNYEISRWQITDDQNPCDNILPTDGPPVRKIFVGNISDRTTQCELRSLFRRFGKVVDCHISRDKRTGLRKNFGFVTYKHPEDALKALHAQRDQLKVHWRDLRVAPADSWHQPQELPDGTVQWKRKGQAPSEDTPLVSAGTEDQEGAVGGVMIQEDTDIDESKCRIHILNDDCLMHIFAFLSKKERVKIERVCKRWQAVSLNTWVYQQHLDFSSMFSAQFGRYLTVNILRAVLQRCGPNLASLDLSHKPHELSSRMFSLIAKFAPNLRCLNLSGIPLVAHSVRTLSNISHHLQHLNLDCCSGAQDRDLQMLFLHCPVLESVTLSRNNQLTGKCVGSLSADTLSELMLDDCNNLIAKYLVNGLKGLKNLKKLSFNSCINLTSTDVAEIIKATPQLTSLSVAKYFPLLNSSALCSVDLLRDLVSLNLQLNPAVNDQVMETISKSCIKIEQLNITGCSIQSNGDIASLSNTGIKSLAKLPHLVDLSMSYMNNVTDEALDAIADKGRLKLLECRGCPTFTDAGCMSVVALCNELELFDISGCNNVTITTIKAAVEAVKLRTNNVKLRIIAGGTQVDSENITEEVPLLHIDMNSYCVAHLRPDFVDDIYFPSDNDDDDESDDHFIDDLIDLDWESHSMLLGADLDCYDFYDHQLYQNELNFELYYDSDN